MTGNLKNNDSKMHLNLDLIGKKIGPEPFSYSRDQVILYALSVGAGVEKELDFVYEKNLKVLPTFATVPFAPAGIQLLLKLRKNMSAVIIHGEHEIVLYKEIPSEGTIYLSTIVDSIYDKGDKGAHINMTIKATDKNKELIYKSKMLLVDQFGGNFGGEPGPEKKIIKPPEGKAPDFKTSYKTSPDICALYRLNGDKTPMHIDPQVAEKTGFKRPFIMGLCTFGLVGRAILHNVCNSDPTRLKSFSTRFVSVVYPGDTLITSGWKIDKNRHLFVTTNQDGKVVLGNTLAKVY